MKIHHAVFSLAFLLLFWGAWGDIGAEYSKVFTSELSNEEIARAGQWGDSFGPFNAFISAAGFIILATTLIVQSRSIKIQALDLHKQRFEASFFEFLRLLRELRTELKFSHSPDYVEKRYKNTKTRNKFSSSDAIMNANYEVVFWLRERSQRENTTPEQISDIYMEYINHKHGNTFGPYFRMIYTILRRIRDDKFLNEKEKVQYANILRSQLTYHEVYLLAFNGLAPVSKDLRDLITEFRMLKYLPPPPSAMRVRLERMYPSAAFTARD